MRKRIFSALLILALFAAFLPSFAAAEADESTILQTLSIMEIMVGDEKGNLNLGNYVTRAEFAKLAVSASLYKDAATAVSHVSPFPDVRSDHWASGYIKTAVDAGWITGYLDGTFVPDNAVKLEEAVTVILKVLGYTDADFIGTYPSGQLALCRALKLNKNVTAAQGATLTRRDCAHLIYNALIAKNRSQVVHAVTLGYGVDANGDIDYLALLNTKMDGPVVVPATGGVAALIGFTPRLVYRNGSVASIGAIAPYDVVYYMESLGTVWVSSAKAHGVYESASPNAAAPSAVTVSGKTYTIGTTTARLALSAVGQFSVGDNITLLLGLDGAVAGVMSPQTEDKLLTGLVLKSGTRSFTNADGSTYSSYYVQIVTTGGQVFDYPTPNDALTAGRLVTVQYTGGAPDVRPLSTASRKISGKVNSAGTKMGSYTFADGIEILDVYESAYASINPSRLSSADISENMVLYYRLNTAGEIDRLILNNVTGDMYTYCVLTNVSERSGSLTASATYQYLVNGNSMTLQSDKIYNNVSVGPAFVRYGKNNQVDLVRNLPLEVNLSALSETAASGNSATYTIIDKVQVYENTSGNVYMLSSIGHLSAQGLSNYSIKGYLDKAESEGGRIRVIIATPKP